MTWRIAKRLSGSCAKASEWTTEQLQAVSKDPTVLLWMLFKRVGQPHTPTGVCLELDVTRSEVFRSALTECDKLGEKCGQIAVERFKKWTVEISLVLQGLTPCANAL